MPAPLSADLRRILDAAHSATSPAVAARFGVSVSTVHCLRRLDREQGSVAPKPHGGSHTPLVTDDAARSSTAISPRISRCRTRSSPPRLEADTGRRISRQTTQRMLAQWRITRKKVYDRRAAPPPRRGGQAGGVPG